MGNDYVYVVGYTSMITGEIILDDTNHTTFNNEMLYNEVIKPILVKEGCTQKIVKLTHGKNLLTNGFSIECNSDMSKAILSKDIVSKGYLYNSKKETMLYSFFFHRVYNEGSYPFRKIEEGEFSETEEIEEEELVNVVYAPSRSDLIQELKFKLKNRKVVNFLDHDKETQVEKSDFLNELEQEVNVRRSRADRRERKIMKKRQQRKSKI